jgi:hypothetical protein
MFMADTSYPVNYFSGYALTAWQKSNLYKPAFLGDFHNLLKTNVL